MRNMHEPKEKITMVKQLLENKGIPLRVMPAHEPWTNYYTVLPNLVFRASAFVYADANMGGLFEWSDGDKATPRKPLPNCQSWGERPKFSVSSGEVVVAFGEVVEDLMQAEIKIKEEVKTKAGVIIYGQAFLEAIQAQHREDQWTLRVQIVRAEQLDIASHFNEIRGKKEKPIEKLTRAAVRVAAVRESRRKKMATTAWARTRTWRSWKSSWQKRRS